MAEQKIDDTKVPTARRGARPFAGPVGTSPAARPFLRPASPAARPLNAPFAPPSIGRPTLGTKPPQSHPAETVQTAEPHAVVAKPPAPEPVALASLPALQPTTEVVATAGHPEAIAPAIGAEIVNPEPRRRLVTSEMVALDAFDAFDATWNGVDASDSRSSPAPAPSPVDELALGTGSGEGDYIWTHDIPVPDAPTPAGQLPDAPSAEVDGGWPTADIGMPAWLADDSQAVNDVAATFDADVDWSDAPSIPSADDVIASAGPTGPSSDAQIRVEAPEQLVASPTDTDSEPVAPVEAEPMTPFTTAVVETESWPDPLLAEYAPYVSVSRETPAYLAVTPPTIPLHPHAGVADMETEAPAISPSRSPVSDESVGERSLPSDTSSPFQAALPTVIEPVDPVAGADSRIGAGIRISATLDRLAERVRGGEIDVSSVAPDATDAAVLASVLAALLGGSSSR